MKGIETRRRVDVMMRTQRSDHCPAMKGIETTSVAGAVAASTRSDHCPAMKGIETIGLDLFQLLPKLEATTAPQ